MGGGLSKQPNKKCFYFGGRNYLLSKEKTDDFFWVSILKDQPINQNGNFPFIGGILYEYLAELGGYNIVKRWGNTKNKAYIVLPCFGGKAVTTLFTLVLFTSEVGFNGPSDAVTQGSKDDTEYILGCQIIHRNSVKDKVDKNSWGVKPNEVTSYEKGRTFEFNIRTNFDLFIPGYENNVYRYTDVIFSIGQPYGSNNHGKEVAVARMILDMQFSDDLYSLDRMRARICTHNEDKVNEDRFKDQLTVKKEFKSLKLNFAMDSHKSGTLVKLSKHRDQVDIEKSFYFNGLNFKGSFWLTVLKDSFSNMNGNLPYIGGSLFFFDDETQEHVLEDTWGNTKYKAYVAIPLFGINNRVSYDKYTLVLYTWEGGEIVEERSSSKNVAILGCHIKHELQEKRNDCDVGSGGSQGFMGYCWGVQQDTIASYEEASLFQFTVPIGSEDISTSVVTFCIGRPRDVDNQPVAVNKMTFDQLPRHYADTSNDHRFEDNFDQVQGRIYTNRDELKSEIKDRYPQQDVIEKQFEKYNSEFANAGRRQSYRYRTRSSSSWSFRSSIDRRYDIKGCPIERSSSEGSYDKGYVTAYTLYGTPKHPSQSTNWSLDSKIHSSIDHSIDTVHKEVDEEDEEDKEEDDDPKKKFDSVCVL